MWSKFTELKFSYLFYRRQKICRRLELKAMDLKPNIVQYRDSI
jgi:hypothetical protein